MVTNLTQEWKFSTLLLQQCGDFSLPFSLSLLTWSQLHNSGMCRARLDFKYSTGNCHTGVTAGQCHNCQHFPTWKINRPWKNGGSWEPHSKLQIVLAETLGLGFRQPDTAESMEDDTMEDAIHFKLDKSSLAMPNANVDLTSRHEDK